MRRLHIVDALPRLLGEGVSHYPISTGKNRLEIVPVEIINDHIAKRRPDLYLSLGYISEAPPIRWPAHLPPERQNAKRNPPRLGGEYQGGAALKREIIRAHAHFLDIDLPASRFASLAGLMAYRLRLAERIASDALPAPPTLLGFSGTGLWAFFPLHDPYVFNEEGAGRRYEEQGRALATQADEWLKDAAASVDIGAASDYSRTCPLFGSPKLYDKPKFGVARFPTAIYEIGDHAFTRKKLRQLFPPPPPRPPPPPIPPLADAIANRGISAFQRQTLSAIHEDRPINNNEDWREGNRHKSALSIYGTMLNAGMPRHIIHAVVTERASRAGKSERQIQNILAWCDANTTPRQG